MKIIRLTIENIKRLTAAAITPTGAVVVVGGKNEAGKSSALDAIAYALGGMSLVPSEPIRRGELEAEVVVDLGEYVVRRTFTRSTADAPTRSALVVTSKDGAKYPSPQAMLDQLMGSLAFDPLAFEREKPNRQAEILRAVVGLDLSDLDAARARLYDERTLINREATQLKARYESAPKHRDAPAELVSVAELSRQLQHASSAESAASVAHAAADRAQERRDAAEEALKRAAEAQTEAEEALAKAKARVEQRWADLHARADELLAADAHAVELQSRVPDAEPIRAQLHTAETTNARVRENQHATALRRQWQIATEKSQALTRQIESIDVTRDARIAEAKFPVAGLGFSASGGVTLNGLPFEQAASSAQLRCSVAIGLAMNPKLRVLLVRDGSLLDYASLEQLGELAAEADAQVWVEMVQEAPDGRTTVYIEDGAVK